MRNHMGTHNPNFRKDIKDKKIIGLYVNKKLSLKKIASQLNCDIMTISRHLKLNNIKLRTTKDYPSPFKGKHHTKKAKKLLKKSRLGKKTSKDIVKKMVENRRKNGWWKHPQKTKQKMRDKYKDEEWLKKTIKRRKINSGLPSQKEKKLIRIFKFNKLPYKYVGNYDFWIKGRCPDFLNCNGKKKVIELFTNNQRRKDYPYNRKQKGTIEHYNKYGYKTLIIWDYELKNPQRIVEKIREFEKR